MSLTLDRQRWFILHLIHLIIQQTGAAVTYAYILIPSLYSVLRTLSDILILCGFWLILKRFRSPSVRMDAWETTAVGALWVLGLYQLGLQFALCFVWLGFVDLGTINSIAAARSGVEVAFTAWQLCLYLLVCISEEFREREPFKAQSTTGMTKLLDKVGFPSIDHDLKSIGMLAKPPFFFGYRRPNAIPSAY